jgi:hypothetical protein
MGDVRSDMTGTMHLKLSSIFRLAAFTSALLFAAVVMAQATVNVRVRDTNGQPVDGQVNLQSTSGSSVSCSTSSGACSLSGVAGGQYRAVFQPQTGSAWPAQPVMIPPSGSVSLTINQRP